MANKVLLKKSSTAAKVPLVGDLDYGELALNYTDGKLYYKTASNTIDQFDSITATATLTNKTWNGNTIGVAYGGTGVTASSGANSVVLRDANQNVTANNFFNNFSTIAASATQVTLTVASVASYQVTGSGGQVFQLPNATTLPSGATYYFNNNQSSGAITINNNSGTLVESVPSGGISTVILLSNATAAGSWDRHDQAPSNVTWSTNTFDYVGSITGATWNGVAVAPNRGGTGVANNVANTITFTGNYSLGLTLSANTAVTLPTTGTLATLAGTETLTNKTLTSPVMTGTPTAPTAADNTVTTQVATTAFADTVALNKAVAMAIALG